MTQFFADIILNSLRVHSTGEGIVIVVYILMLIGIISIKGLLNTLHRAAFHNVSGLLCGHSKKSCFQTALSCDVVFMLSKVDLTWVHLLVKPKCVAFQRKSDLLTH